MNFLSPWVALGLASVVIPTLVLFYFLKLRRREELVSSTFLWRRAVQDLQVNAPFQRLRKNLLLLLQLLILAAALFALARPIVKSELSKERSLVLMIDRSASMRTAEAGGTTRFAEAREQALRLVKTLNRTGTRWWSWIVGDDDAARVMVISFADRATVVSPFTTNMSDVSRLIEQIEPTDARTNLREALDLAVVSATPGRGNMDNPAQPSGPGAMIQNPVNPEEASRIVLFSDGCVGELSDVAVKEANVSLIRVGEATDNVGITALRIQRNYERPELLSVFVQVKNFGPGAIDTDVALYVNGRIGSGRVESVRLGPLRRSTTKGAGSSNAAQEAPASGDSPGSAAALSFEFPLNEGAEIEARLSRDDPFMIDNRAYAIVPPPRELKVLLVSEGNSFLEKILENLPIEKPYVYKTPAQYEAASMDDLAVEGRSIFDVVIFDKCGSERLPMGNYIFLGALPPIEPIKRLEDASDPFALMWWDETHPILRHVGLDYVYVGQALRGEFPKEAQVLMEGPHGPVMVRYDHQGRQFLCVTFAVERSNLRVKPAFPILMYNAIRFLGSGAAISERDATRPGDVLTFSIGESSATLVRPDDKSVELKPDGQGIARYAGTDRVGVYRLKADGAQRAAVAVNLEDAAESDITPPEGVNVGGQVITPGEAIRTATPEIWRWFIGAALLIAFLEWYVYNRRVMI